MHIFLMSGLGDEVALTGVVREAKRTLPDEFIFVQCSRPELFEGSPYVGFGKFQKKGTTQLTPWHSGKDFQGNLVRYYARQLGVTCLDDTPEIFLTDEEKAKAKKRLASFPGKKIAFDVFATWTNRQWPIDRFIDVARMLEKMGFMTIELGKKVPDNDGLYAKKRIKANLDLVDQLKVRETAAILSECDLYVGNDSGLMHLAAAVGTPQVAIFTISPWWARTYWTTTPVFRNQPCRIECTFSCVKKERCILEITVEDVMAAIGNALRRYPK